MGGLQVQMKTVLFCDQYGSMGGGQQVLLELARAAQASGIMAKAMLPEGSCSNKLEAIGAEVRRIPVCNLTQGKKGIFDICRCIIHNLSVFLKNISFLRSADLIYINGSRLLLLAFLSQIFLRKKVAFHIHLNHGNKEKNFIRYFLGRFRTTSIVVPSFFIKHELIKFHPDFDSHNVFVIENGLDSRFTGLVFEDKFNRNPLLHIGIVGRITPEKGYDVLPNLANRFSDMTFHVLGDAAFSSKDYEESLKHRCPSNVFFHGWVNDLPKKIKEIGLQICLVPSRNHPNSPEINFEAAPLVPLQMTALSCLVIVRNIGALKEVANKLELRSFVSDEELDTIIEDLRNEPPQNLVACCRKSYEAVEQHYSNRIFQQKLKEYMIELMSM